MLEYVVQHRVVHGVMGAEPREYAIGERFDTAGVTPEELAALRKAGALKLREEMEAAETTADRIAQLELEKRALLEKLEKLTAAAQKPAEPSDAGDGEGEKPTPAKKASSAK